MDDAARSKLVRLGVATAIKGVQSDADIEAIEGSTFFEGKSAGERILRYYGYNGDVVFTQEIKGEETYLDRKV